LEQSPSGHIAQREHAANYQAYLAHREQEQIRVESEAHLRREEQERQLRILQEEQTRRNGQEQKETVELIKLMQQFAEEESRQQKELEREELRRQEMHEQLLAEGHQLWIEKEHIRREEENR